MPHRLKDSFFRALFHSPVAGMAVADLATESIVEVNELLLAILGRGRDEILGVPRVWRSLTPPEYQHLDEEAFRQLLAEGHCDPFEKEYIRPDGSRVPVRVSSTVVPEFPDKLIVFVTDITAERERDAALRDSEAQLRLLADSMPVLISFVDSDLRYRFVNRAYESWFGLARDDVLGKRIDELLGTDAMAARIEPAQRALSGEAQSFETFTPRADGARRITELQYIPRLAENGRPDGFFVFATDITERKMLLEELHHRVKNTLAIVQALARQSFKSLPDANGALESFEHRLEALSSAHSILTHQSWEAASIRELVNSSIAPYQTRASAFDATGPDFKVDSNTAVGLALTLNELATNAVKHGALTSPNGSVAIHWQLENSHMELVWRESGGPPVTPPTKRGFGTRMIERGLASKLRAAVKIEFEPDGLVCTLAAPVTQLPQEAA